MTQTQYIINRKLNILELGEVLGNISEACRTLGISRQHYYDIRTAIEEEGLDGLLEKSRCAPRPSNRVAPHIEQAVLDYSMDFPTHGHVRVANELRKKGLIISPGGVRCVWLRHDLQLKGLRLKRLERWAADNAGILTESQVEALENAKEDREAHGVNTVLLCPLFAGIKCPFFIGIKCPFFAVTGFRSPRPLRV